MKFDGQLTLLTEGQVWGNEFENQLGVLKKYGPTSELSDLAILMGGFGGITSMIRVPDDKTLKGRVGFDLTQSTDSYGRVVCVNCDGSKGNNEKSLRTGIIRPIIQSSYIFSQVYPSRVSGYNGLEEVEFGEYPQYAPSKEIQEKLESEYSNGRLQLTGGNYTFDIEKSGVCNIGEFIPGTFDEYQYEGKKYIRVSSKEAYMDYLGFDDDCIVTLSNGENGNYENEVWIEVTPVKWLVDTQTQTLVSKVGLLSGIRFDALENRNNIDFSQTDIKAYLDEYMLRDLLQSTTLAQSKGRSI